MMKDKNKTFRQLLNRASLATAVAGLLLTGCSSTGTEEVVTSDNVQAVQAPGKNAPGVKADCKIWSAIIDGPYKYENNQWGEYKTEKPFEQCLLTKNVDGKQKIGWSWNWADHDPSVFAYPQIIFGWKPWSGGKPSHPAFPLKVADADLEMVYDVEMEATGSYNLAPEIWLIENNQWTEEAKPALLTTEIMFWMDYKEGARPAGDIIDTVTLDGKEYELWLLRDISNNTDVSWDLYSFKSLDIQHKGTIDITGLLKFMTDKGYIDPEEYIASVEFGNEVVGGSGETWVNHFEVKVH